VHRARADLVGAITRQQHQQVGEHSMRLSTVLPDVGQEATLGRANALLTDGILAWWLSSASVEA
jgi:hypothetical protein